MDDNLDERIIRALRRVGHGLHSDPDWQAKVLARISRPTRWRRFRVWLRRRLLMPALTLMHLPCRDLYAFVDGELRDEREDRFLEHLGGCRRCQRDFLFQEQLTVRLAALQTPKGDDGGIK